MDELERLRSVMLTLQNNNRLRNDQDAFIYELCEWALGNREDKPIDTDFGILFNP